MTGCCARWPLSYSLLITFTHRRTRWIPDKGWAVLAYDSILESHGKALFSSLFHRNAWRVYTVAWHSPWCAMELIAVNRGCYRASTSPRESLHRFQIDLVIVTDDSVGKMLVKVLENSVGKESSSDCIIWLIDHKTDCIIWNRCIHVLQWKRSRTLRKVTSR